MVIRFPVSACHCAITALLAAALLPTQSALAANPDLIVTKFINSLDGSCDSDCSLREAVQQANQTPGASRIVLAAGTYQLRIPKAQGPDGRTIDDDDNLNGDLDI